MNFCAKVCFQGRFIFGDRTIGAWPEWTFLALHCKNVKDNPYNIVYDEEVRQDDVTKVTSTKRQHLMGLKKIGEPKPSCQNAFEAIWETVYQSKLSKQTYHLFSINWTDHWAFHKSWVLTFNTKTPRGSLCISTSVVQEAAKNTNLWCCLLPRKAEFITSILFSLMLWIGYGTLSTSWNWNRVDILTEKICSRNS